MSIVDQQLVDIEIVTSAGGVGELQLKYQGQIYGLQQAFAVPKLDSSAVTLRERVKQQWQQLTTAFGDRYLLVREVGYYSLWELADSSLDDSQALTTSIPGKFDDVAETLVQRQKLGGGIAISMEKLGREGSRELDLQQASIWLFQESWLRLEDLIGARQLQLSADNLLVITPQVKSLVDLDRLLTLDPLTNGKLGSWSADDFATFDRQIYHLTQRKLGQKFGTELTLDIIQSMPERLQLVLDSILDLR